MDIASSARSTVCRHTLRSVRHLSSFAALASVGESRQAAAAEPTARSHTCMHMFTTALAISGGGAAGTGGNRAVGALS